MMMLSEIANALNTKVIGNDVNVLSVGTDSRNIEVGQLFVAIKGERFDGNQYAEDAISKGAAAVLISDTGVKAMPAVLVDDTRKALGELAHYWRQKLNMPVVAVTGSSGKTTIKEMIAAILKVAKGRVLATKGNLNNDIGMPLTLLKMRAEHSCAVIEMGMNHLGEIRYLTNIAKPQVAIVNNAGTAHIGEVGSRQAIAEAKGEIFEGLADDGLAVINADDDYADYWQTLNAHRQVMTFGLEADADVSAQYDVQGNETHIQLKTQNGEVDMTLNLLGKHNVMNVLAASAVAVGLGVSNAEIVQGLSAFAGVQGRLNLAKGINGAIVIDDTYNANPDSMKVAIDVLAELNVDADKQLLFVMGDMAELGEEAESMHAELGAYARGKGISTLISFGEMSRLASQAFGKGGQHFDALEPLIEVVTANMHAKTVVLVKGSRMMRMERVVKAIIEEQKLGSAH